jgi:hypothetical protein
MQKILRNDLNSQLITTTHFEDSTIHQLREDFHLCAGFSPDRLWKPCGSRGRPAHIQHPDQNTHEVHNQKVRLSEGKNPIMINKHTTPTRFSTFPQGLLRLRVFRVLFLSFRKSSSAVIFSIVSKAYFWESCYLVYSPMKSINAPIAEAMSSD